MSFADKRILLVDDLGLARERLRQTLVTIGFTSDNIHEKAMALPALEALRAGARGGVPYDLLLTDWLMPEMSGIELLRACKADPALGRLKIMIVSSEGESTSVIDAITAGADAYGVKPVTNEDLMRQLTKLLA